MNEILKMLGVASEAEALAAITRFNALMDGTMHATEAQNGQEALSRVRATFELMKKIEATCGAQGAEALAKLEAWKEMGGRVQDVEAQLRERDQQAEQRDAQAAIAKAVTDGKLVPALREKADKFYAEHGFKALLSYLDALVPTHVPQTSQEPQPRQPSQPASTPTQLTDAERVVMKALGRSEEETLLARKFWDESNGEFDAAYIRKLNKQHESAAKQTPAV